MTLSTEVAQLREMLSAHIEDSKLRQRERITARPRDAERLDPTPVAVPIEQQDPPSMRELVHEYVQGALSQQAADADLGTFEEEDDFVEEDPELLNMSGFEISEFPMEDEIPIEDASPPVAAPEPPEPVPAPEPPVAGTEATT